MGESPGPRRGGVPDLTRFGEDGSWLKRLAWRLIRATFHSEIVALNGYADSLAEQLVRRDEARAELQRHCDTRTDQVVAELADLRRALFSAPADAAAVPAGDGPAGAGRVQSVGAVTELQHAVRGVQSELEGVRDGVLPALGREITNLQHETEGLRDRRVPAAEADLAHLQSALAGVLALAEELRDGRLPALSARVDALVERLYEELTATASLVERVAAGESMHLALDPVTEAAIPPAVQNASRAFIDAFRGGREEIQLRVGEYLPMLREAGPVLDLGCGRGELLEVLGRDGIAAAGIDSDPAMVEACRRRGLAVTQSDAVGALREVTEGSLGAVCAIHLLEHLPAASWMAVVELAARALRRGGLLIVECPNPEALRVGANLFWVDPTHRAPVHPDGLAFVMRACGFEVVEVRRVRPFPEDQRLARAEQSEELRELARRLDAYLSGPRDFAVVARRSA
ncbi:MAG: class I SAM-dependent methyltransferase [Acidobacteriota bacterium]